MTARPRNLLLISFHFPPSAASGSFRLLGFARHLPELGWTVTVVAPPAMPDEPVDPGLAARVPSSVDVRAVAYPAHAGKIARVLFPFALWLVPAGRALRSLLKEQRPDAVLTSGPPHVVHLLGLWLSRRHRIPWIADFRDPWVNDGLGRPARWIDRWFLLCERAVYRHADRILANAPNAMEVYRRQHPAEKHKVRLLTNGFDPRPAPRKSAESAAHRPFRLVHAGEIYLGRDPLPLLDAIAELQRTPSVQGLRLELHILGRADVGRAEMERAIRERGLGGNVVFRGQVSYQESLEAVSAADINVLFDTPNRRFGVPAKLYEYFGAQRPILALAEPDGDAAAILRESGLVHRIAHPRNSQEIRAALAELVAAAGTPAVTDAARLARFTRERLARDLSEIIGELVDERGAQHGN